MEQWSQCGERNPSGRFGRPITYALVAGGLTLAEGETLA